MKIKFWYFLFVSISCSTLQAQDFDTNLSKLFAEYGQERMYFHFDKSAYTAGDTIWFKSYLMKAIEPSGQSKTLYVDWTDENGNLLQRTNAPIVEATAFGQFAIPAEWKGNAIHVKAYTKWMLNFDSTFLYNKDIQILNASNSKNKVRPAIIPQLSFFPEGGNLIANVPNKIAFKANDQWGKPVKISGKIKNHTGKIIDSLVTIHDGMGYIFLTPSAGATYTVTWKDPQNKEHISHLPTVQEKGTNILVSLQEKSRTFTIHSSGGAVENKLYTVVGTMYQQPVFKFQKNIQQGKIQGLISTEELPTGILTITAFDENMKPVAERITFINNEESVYNSELEVQHWGLNKRAKNEIEITVPDSLLTNMSVSVTDMNIAYNEEDNIITHLFLTGELKGSVSNAAYYFQNNSDTISQALDLVMLTNGWRKINWMQVTSGNFTAIQYPADTAYLSISGTVYGPTSVQFKNAGSIIVMYNDPNTGNKVVPIPIKADGSFNDPSLILFDTAKVYYQLPRLDRSTATVQFMQNRLPAFGNQVKASGTRWFDTTGHNYQFGLADLALKEIAHFKGQVLETVEIKARQKSTLEMMDEKYASGLFSGGNSTQFDLLNDPTAIGSGNIFQYLQSKVAGLQITLSGNTSPTVKWRNATPAFYVNEMPADVEMLSTISLSDIAYVKAINPPFMGAPGGGSGGAIAIYLKRGDDIKPAPGKGLPSNMVTGYTAVREFYSPNYEVIRPEADVVDRRTTLYWNPEILTQPGSSKIRFQFFNNDVTEGFRVVIQGMSVDGKLTHLVKILE